MLLVLFVVTTVQSTLIYFTPLGLLVLFVFLVLFCRYYKLVTPLVLLVLFVLFRRYYGSAHTQLHHPSCFSCFLLLVQFCPHSITPTPRAFGAFLSLLRFCPHSITPPPRAFGTFRAFLSCIISYCHKPL